MTKFLEKVIEQAKRKNVDLKKNEIENLAKITIETIREELKKGNKINIRGFGTFKAIKKPPVEKKIAGRKVQVPERIKVIFIPSKKILD